MMNPGDTVRVLDDPFYGPFPIGWVAMKRGPFVKVCMTEQDLCGFSNWFSAEELEVVEPAKDAA